MSVRVSPARAWELRGLSIFITISRWLGFPQDGEKPCNMVFYGGLGVLLTLGERPY